VPGESDLSPGNEPLGRVFLYLLFVGVQDREDEAGKTLLEFIAARDVVHFHPPPFGSDESGLAQSIEMLRQSRFRNRPVADLSERRAILRALRRSDVGKDGRPRWIGQSVENPFQTYGVQWGVKDRLHDLFYIGLLKDHSIIPNYGTLELTRVAGEACIGVQTQ
jgi:hypothetical protein